MPDIDLLFAFVATVTVLMLVPGPNVALIVANSVAHGSRFGLITVAGTSSAMVAQLGLVALGVSEALHAFGGWFDWIRWIGIAYLLYLGMEEWRARPVDLAKAAPEPRSVRAIYLRARVVSLTNPKTLLFCGAFFPQFIVADRGAGEQVLVLSATFLFVAVAIDGTWAIASGRARPLIGARGRLRHRLSGGLLITTGIGLALARSK